MEASSFLATFVPMSTERIAALSRSSAASSSPWYHAHHSALTRCASGERGDGVLGAELVRTTRARDSVAVAPAVAWGVGWDGVGRRG